MTSTLELQHKRIHFMGAGGIGVSALLRLASARGALVSGCDREESEQVRLLAADGFNIQIGHDPAHAEGIDLLVHTSAIPHTHPELLAAGRWTMRRGTFLARLMENFRCIGVAGTHGKTSTTWFTAQLLLAAEKDPAVVLGGNTRKLGGNLRLGQGDLFLTELDESDASFLEPKLETAVITNVESDHLHHYGTFAEVKKAFASFAAGVGFLVGCADDAETSSLLKNHAGEKCGFGILTDADLKALNPVAQNGGTKFSLACRGETLGEYFIPLPGRCNLYNALAACAVALRYGATAEQLRVGLSALTGVDRRLQKMGEGKGVALYTDYAHHPTEIKAAIQALRESCAGKLLVVFQPHLYSRTRDYAAEFGVALAKADATMLVDLYPAREEPLPGVSSQLLVESVNNAGGKALGSVPLKVVPEEIVKLVSDFSTVVLMGAGDIEKAVAGVLAKLRG